MGLFDKFKSIKEITPEERRKKNNEYIKGMGIACLDNLPTIESSSDVKLKDLDMLDLYYRYHWACVEKRVRPETNIGVLNPEVVWERRKGLEWLVSSLTDWNYNH